MLPCFKLNIIPKKDFFDSKKFLVIFTVILCSTALTSILSCVRYVSEQTCKVTCFSYVVFLFFFPVKWHYLVFAGHVFSLFRGFNKKIISLCQAVQLAFISTRRRERYSPVSQILQLVDLSSPRKEGLKLIFSPLITMVITVETRGVCKTSLHCTFYFDRTRSPYMHTTFRT